MPDILCQHQKDQKAIRLPSGLFPGDKVGIVAPGSPFDHVLFERGVSMLRRMGYRPVWSEGLFARSGYLAGADAHRAEQLDHFFKDSEIKAILCARGGFGSLRTLDLLDFEAIGRHPKIFLGFSDITALLAAFGKCSALVTYHGPTLTDLAEASEETREHLAAALASAVPEAIRSAGGPVLRGGQVSGTLVGGNLTTLCHLLGTPFSPDYRGKILLLEDRGEAPYRIDRMLTQMRLAGCLEAVSGVVLGSFEGCGQATDIYRIVSDAFGAHEVPILAGMPIGHGKTNHTVAFGLAARLDADAGSLSFSAPAALEG